MNMLEMKLECLRFAIQHDKPSSQVVADAAKYFDFLFPQALEKSAKNTKRK